MTRAVFPTPPSPKTAILNVDIFIVFCISSFSNKKIQSAELKLYLILLRLLGQLAKQTRLNSR